MKLEIPLRLPSLANQRLHWAVKAKQTKAQRDALQWAWRAEIVRMRARGDRTVTHFPCVVTLTRVGPRELDDDNIRPAFKAIRDEIAAQLGFDDSRRSPIRWEYRQVKRGKDYAVLVEINAEAKAAEG